ncbi:MAG: leucine-rich repeat protein [Prevotella sp.]|nr:leucine-rich repeat protein [Prevotella sp.]
MKTILQRLMCIAITAMTCMSVNAQETSGSCGDNATWEYDSGTLTISGTGEITTYSTDMPTAYPWYAQAANIQTVIIGEGITNIPAWAFAMYENLLSIRLPSTLKTIGWSALEETALWNVWLPEGLEKIEGYAFMMTPFSTVSIPSTVTEIGERAFGYCENLVSVGCYAATPPTLGSNAFGDSPVATVYVASSKVADYQAATGWSAFDDKIQSPAGYCGPDGSDDDGDNDETKATWSYEMSTRTLTIEGTKMGQYNRPWESAGMGGTGGGFNPDNNVGYPCGIEHVVIGEGIAAIPPMSFYMEVGIKTVTLPSTLTAIGMNAFSECFNIETITCDATTPPSLAAEVDPNWGLENPETYVIFGTLNDESGEPNPIETLTAIYVPTASVADYKAAAGWSVYADKIVANTITGINAIDNGPLTNSHDAPTYNLSGQRVRNGYKGIVVRNGRKIIMK